MGYDRIPLDLRANDQWLNWREEIRDGKPTKVPYNSRTGTHAAVNNPRTWSSFDAAVSMAPYYNGVTLGGIGRVFTRSDPFAGIDLDNKHPSPENQARHKLIVEAANSYTETSPHGGAQVIVRADVSGGGRRWSQYDIEAYSLDRWFTFTGNILVDRPIMFNQPLIDEIIKQLDAGRGNSSSDTRNYTMPNGPARQVPQGWLTDVIVSGVPVGQRSDKFYWVVGELKALDWTPDQIERLSGRKPRQR